MYYIYIHPFLHSEAYNGKYTVPSQMVTYPDLALFCFSLPSMP